MTILAQIVASFLIGGLMVLLFILIIGAVGYALTRDRKGG